MKPEERLASLGLVLPPPIKLPEGLHLPFTFVNLRGDRALISGHPKHDMEGRIAGPFGQLGAEVTTEEGAAAARDIALSVLANLKAEIGDLSRVTGWVRVFGMVNSAPGNEKGHPQGRPHRSWSSGRVRGFSALACLEPALGLVDHVDPALAAHDAAIAVALLERAERVLDLHGSSPSSRRGDAP
jgi:hypothetical protein